MPVSKGNGALLETLDPVSNDGQDQLALELPYVVRATIEGTAALLFHRWSVESVETKSRAAKGSAAKKSDDINSYVYRDNAGHICLPGEYVRMAVIGAARYAQDPRSPRKSAMDLFKAGVIVLDELASLGTKDWDYLDRRRVTVQRNGITRVRPAMLPGWRATLRFQVLTPEYIPAQLFHATLATAGRLIGCGDFRPTYGRFSVTRYEVMQA